jgi:hypothetical protein
MRTTSLLLLSAIALAFAAGANAQQKKLYRWTDADGKVHYTDQLPPEAAESARDQLNDRGIRVDHVARAPTPEERAAAAAEEARLAEEKRQREEKIKMDNVLMASYPTEGDLERAYKERFDLIEQSVESARVGIRSQEKSLADLLAHAGDLERNGRPVPATVVDSIGKARQQVADQQAYLGKREAERVALQKEYDDVLARHRTLSAAASGNSGGATQQ